MVTRSDAIVRAVLERCGRSPEGHAIDPSSPTIEALIEEGFLMLSADGLVVTTDKGRQALKLLEEQAATRKDR